jgi:hypothetical protein
MFMALLVILSTVTALFTEAVKCLIEGMGGRYASNLVVLVVSIIVGIGGTGIAYIFMGIPFILPNIICMVLMAVAVWVGSMVGYDKVLQMLEQMKVLK